MTDLAASTVASPPSDRQLARRTIAFVNIAHALDHYVLLIFPTAVLAMAATSGDGYAHLIGLSTGAYVAFGLCSIPFGWLAVRTGRRNLLAVYFFGYGASCLGVTTASPDNATLLAAAMIVLGIFSAIYHPIGAAMLAANTTRLGHDLGWNGVWGNMGAALASGGTALIAATWGWRAAFIVPGLVCIVIGAAFLALVPHESRAALSGSKRPPVHAVSRPALLLALFAAAIIAGGMTFNITTIALPKIVDERLDTKLALGAVGWIATSVFVVGALTQLTVGRLIDRVSLPALFAGLSVLQPVGLGLAALTTSLPMLAGLALAMAAIYGQVVVNDAMVARYVPDRWRAQAYGIRYALGFTASGFAAPMIAYLHAGGGFTPVLLATSTFGLIVFLSGLAFYAVSAREPVPSEPSALCPATSPATATS